MPDEMIRCPTPPLGHSCGSTGAFRAFRLTLSIPCLAFCREE
jgi:hypothetical protein